MHRAQTNSHPPAHLLFMDTTNPNTSTTGSWDLDVTMGNQLLLDQLPLEMVPHSLIHAQPLPTSSGFPTYQMVSQKDVGGEHHGEGEEEEETEEEKLEPMKEMLYKIAAMQPVDIDPATIKKPNRRNVRISDDPQSIAARHRRERISERMRILQRLVPGGSKMDTASMLDEAIQYVKFLKRQVRELQSNQHATDAGLVSGQSAPAADWSAMRPDAPGSSSFMGGGAPLPGLLGFSFSGDGSCNHMH